MATWSVGGPPGAGASLQDIQDYLIRLDRALEFHQNSINGENLTDWIMTVPGSTTVRAHLGYSQGDGLFHFTLYNSSGVATVDINSSGDAVFTGLVTGSSVAGGTIRTGTSNGARIQMSSNMLATYDSSGKKNGPAWGLSVGSEFGEIVFYDDDVESARIFNDIGVGWGFQQFTTAQSLFLGLSGAPTFLDGYVRVATGSSDSVGFFSASASTALTVTNPSTATAAATYGAGEQAMLQDASNAVHALIAALHTYGLV